MKVIIAGSRTITDYTLVHNAIAASGWSDEITEVISGGAPGVDTLGEQWAKKHNIPITILAASWQLHGKAAGPIRNQEMADYAEALIAIWDGKSSGTKDMINRSGKMGLRVYVLTWCKLCGEKTGLPLKQVGIYYPACEVCWSEE